MDNTPASKPAPKLQGRIAKVSIQGFRSLRQIESLELPQLTVLIGANGAGKSTLIKFFEMLSWMLKAQHLQEFVLRHGGGDDQFFMGARQTPAIHADRRRFLQIEERFGQTVFVHMVQQVGELELAVLAVVAWFDFAQEQ